MVTFPSTAVAAVVGDDAGRELASFTSSCNVGTDEIFGDCGGTSFSTVELLSLPSNFLLLELVLSTKDNAGEAVVNNLEDSTGLFGVVHTSPDDVLDASMFTSPDTGRDSLLGGCGDGGRGEVGVVGLDAENDERFEFCREFPLPRPRPAPCCNG